MTVLRVTGVFIAIAAGAACFVSHGPAVAQDLSAGCEALRGGSGALAGKAFNAGEVITITFTAAGGVPGDFSYGLTTPTTQTLFVGPLNGPTKVVKINVAAAAVYTETVGSTGAIYNVDLNCSTASGDAASSSIASVSIAGAAAGAVTGQIFDRVSTFGGPPAPTASVGESPFSLNLAGGAGAGASTPVGIWFNFNYTGVKDSFALTALEGDVFTGVGGVDHQVNDDLVLGVAATVSGAVVDTEFNLGGIDSVTGGLAPYASLRLSDNVSADAAFGYLYGRSEAERRAGAVATGALIEGDFSTRTYLAAGNINGFVNEGPAVLKGRLGASWTRSFVSDYEESNGDLVRSSEVTLGEVSVEAQPSYRFQSGALFVEPYLLAEYAYRFMQTEIDTGVGAQEHPNDRHGGEAGAGFRLFHADGLSGQVEGRRSLGWQDQTQTSISGNVRLDF